MFTCERMPGQCGAFVFHHFADKFSYADIKRSLAGEPFDVGLVYFSGNRRQENAEVYPNSPHTFARWLKEKGELVKATPWHGNPRHNSEIRVYKWVPSDKFRAAINGAQV